MVEQAIYFALGCVLTALCALMFAPVFWRRALKLTRQRLRLQVPLSMQEILAERDQLRAEFAVERLRIEQEMERIHLTKTADMADIGRRSLQVTALSNEVTALRRLGTSQESEIGSLQREVAEARAEIGSLNVALDDAHALTDTWREKTGAAEAEQIRLLDEAKDTRTTIVSLETRIVGLEVSLADMEKAGLARGAQAEETLRHHLESAKAQAARHETAGISLRREADDAKAQIRAVEAELAKTNASLAEGSLARRAQTENVEKLEAENAALQSALATAGAKGADAEPEEGSDEELRASIHALGLAVAMMTRKAAAAEAQAAKIKRDKAPRPVEVS